MPTIILVNCLWQFSISIITPQFPRLAVGAHTCTAYSKWGLTKALWNGGQRSLAFELTTASGWNSFKSFVPAYPANRVSFDLPRYGKIPKISPGAYVRREICVSKSIGLALFLEGNLPFFFFFKLIHLHHWSTLLLYKAYRYTITLLLYSNYLTILIYNTE